MDGRGRNEGMKLHLFITTYATRTFKEDAGGGGGGLIDGRTVGWMDGEPR